MNDRRRSEAYDYGCSAQPVVVAAWSGRCSIPSRNIDISLSAHVSNQKPRLKASEVASMMPESLCLDILPRLDVWPSDFESSPPTERNIDLFFFSEERDESVLDSLLIEAIRSNFTLKAVVGDAELLIFHSLLMPEKLHGFQGKFYFWGLFRDKKQAFSHESDCDVPIQNTGEKESISLTSGNPVSFDGKEVPNSSENSPGVSNFENTEVHEVHKKRLVSKGPLCVRKNHFKKRTAPKRRCKSSASSSYDRNRFVSREAAKRYAENYSKRSIIPERGFADGILEDTITAHGWHALVSHPSEAIIPIVREFYANAEESKDSSKVFVRGKWVPFDQNTINILYNISKTSDEDYVTLCEGSIDPKEIVRVIAYPDTHWKSYRGDVLHFPQSSLLPESKAWHYLISAKLLPSNNVNKVHKKRAILNYAIHLHLPINVGRIIESHFKHILKGPKYLGLSYPSLITALCLNAGVKVLDTDEHHKPRDAINEATLAKYESFRMDQLVLDDEAQPSSHTPENKPSDQEVSDDEAEPSAPAPENESCDASGFSKLQDQLSELRRSVNEMRAYQQQIFEYQVQFNTAMAATLSLQPRFPAPPPIFSAAATSFPNPPNGKKA